MKPTSYKSYIKKVIKRAQFLLGDKVIYEPKNDGKSFDMLAHAPSLNENVKIGQLQIEKNFMDFLGSTFTPEGSHPKEKAYMYFKNKDLDIMGPEPYQTIAENLKKVLRGTAEEVNSFIYQGISNAPLKVVLDKGEVSENKQHALLVQAYDKWLNMGKGRVSEPIPHMASKTKKTDKISSRDKGAGYAKK